MRALGRRLRARYRLGQDLPDRRLAAEREQGVGQRLLLGRRQVRASATSPARPARSGRPTPAVEPRPRVPRASGPDRRPASKRRHLLPAQPPVLHLVERDQPRPADLGVDVGQRGQGRLAIVDSQDRINQRMLEKTIAALPKAAQQGGHRLGIADPAERLGGLAPDGGRVTLDEPGQVGDRRPVAPESRRVGGGEPDALVLVGERLPQRPSAPPGCRSGTGPRRPPASRRGDAYPPLAAPHRGRSPPGRRAWPDGRSPGRGPSAGGRRATRRVPRRSAARASAACPRGRRPAWPSRLRTR